MSSKESLFLKKENIQKVVLRIYNNYLENGGSELFKKFYNKVSNLMELWFSDISNYSIIIDQNIEYLNNLFIQENSNLIPFNVTSNNYLVDFENTTTKLQMAAWDNNNILYQRSTAINLFPQSFLNKNAISQLGIHKRNTKYYNENIDQFSTTSAENKIYKNDMSYLGYDNLDKI